MNTMEMEDALREAAPAMDAGPGPRMEAAGEIKRLEQCVPVDAISIPDEAEKLEAPEPGDTVRYEVEGKVSRVEGGHVYVDPVAINGRPVAAAPTPAAELGELERQAGELGAIY